MKMGVDAPTKVSRKEGFLVISVGGRGVVKGLTFSIGILLPNCSRAFFDPLGEENNGEDIRDGVDCLVGRQMPLGRIAV